MTNFSFLLILESVFMKKLKHYRVDLGRKTDIRVRRNSMGIPIKKVVFFATLIVSLFLSPVWAQGGEMSRGPFAVTVSGSTGLFTIFTADTMKRGEFAVTVSHHNYDRDPGDIDVNVNPFSITVGLTDRIELFVTANFNQSVERDGKYFPSPTTKVPGNYPYPYRYRYNPDHPFMDHRSFGNGMGDVLTGVKVNVLSEERGNSVGLAFRGFVKVPTVRKAEELRRGRGTGEVDGGADAILSKRFGPVGTHYNVGYTFVGNPGADGDMTIDLRDKLRLGFGLNAPITSRIQGVFEINNTTFVGNHTDTSGPVNPVDLFGGIRFYPSDWFAFGAGYRHFINSTDTVPLEGTFSEDHHGFTVQAGFQRRKNAIPVVLCNIKSSQVLQGQTTQLTAHATDLDYNAKITYAWTTTGGSIEGDGEVVTFKSEGTNPGVYTITVTAKDNRGGTATCDKQVTVLKRNGPPTVRLEPEKVAVTMGDTTQIRAIAADPDNDKLTYSWTVAGEKVAFSGQELVFGSEGRNLGDHGVVCTVDDGSATAQAKSVVTVNAKSVNLPPTVRCEVESSELTNGQTTKVRATYSDPEGDAVRLEWTAAAGSIEGSGAQVVYKAKGLSAGGYVIRVQAIDARGATGVSTCQVNVREKLIIRMEMLRVDNIAKGVLDDVALKMQSDPRLHVALTGYSDQFGSKRISESAAQQRADAVKNYLVKNHKINESRISVKNGGTSNPIAPNTTLANRKKNRRVELELYLP